MQAKVSQKWLSKVSSAGFSAIPHTVGQYIHCYFTTCTENGMFFLADEQYVVHEHMYDAPLAKEPENNFLTWNNIRKKIIQRRRKKKLKDYDKAFPKPRLRNTSLGAFFCISIMNSTQYMYLYLIY